MELVIFGQRAPQSSPNICFPIHYTGHLQQDLSLRTLYSSADVMVIRSRQDNLPNTGVEALACGTPVVAFNTGGLSDVVEHQRTGYLAKAFDSYDLAKSICWVIDHATTDDLHAGARDSAARKCAHPVVSEKYKQTYLSATTETLPCILTRGARWPTVCKMGSGFFTMI
jgi:glycosyltransferase involved in cell wall biosynthesis